MSSILMAVVEEAVDSTMKKRIELINKPENIIHNLPDIPMGELDLGNVMESINLICTSIIDQLGFQIPDKLLQPIALGAAMNIMMTEIDVTSGDSIKLSYDPLAFGFLPQELGKFLKPFNHP